MLNPRWWDVAMGAGSATLAVALLFGLGPGSVAERIVALLMIVALGLAYLFIARPGIGEPAGWRFPAFLAVAAGIVLVGTAAAPFLAMLQVLVYPLVWVLGDTRRRGIAGSVVIAVAIVVGYGIEGDFSLGALISGATTAGFSLAFAVALGLWISSIAEYGEERARLLVELTAAQAEVEALSRDRGAAQERERLARDIHDTLAQTLAGLVILAERAGRLARDSGDPDASARAIETVEQLAREALTEARALVARTAAVPSDAAFSDAVTRLADRFRTEGEASIELRLDGAHPSLDRDAQVVLLRCLQEMLANVRKHAAASRVLARIDVDEDGSARLEVSDDGRGFDPLAPRAGFGIDGMSERVALAGGTFEVVSTPGHGTVVRVHLPAVRVRAGGVA